MKTLLPAGLKKVSSRADKSYDLVFNTRELGGDEAAFLLGQLMTEGWLIWAANEQDVADVKIPDEKADSMTGQKTPSKRLMDRMFVYYTQGKGGDKDKFRQWYEAELERIGNVYLEKLNA